MSQGDRLLRAIESIGCPLAKELTGEGLDWMFELEPCLPFLEWFVECVESDVDGQNIVTDEELQRYDELVASGEGIIEGDKLSEALMYTQSSEKDNTPVESLREEIHSTKQKCESMDKRLHKLVSQRNQLSLHQAKCSHKLNQMNEVTKKEKQKYKNLLENSQTISTQMDTATNELQQTVCELTEFFTDTDNKSTRKGFLSQLDYNDYFECEELFTVQLTNYTKKQFFEGIADMAGRNDKSRYELLDLSDPASLLIRGESEEVTMNNCQELARLKSVYIPSKTQELFSQAKAVGNQAAVSFAKQKYMNMHYQHTAADVDTLRDQVKETQSALHFVNEDIKLITEKTLPTIIQELAELQPTKILEGDYELKISRQNYFTSKQDQVINELLCQRSRYEFLSMALEVEGCKNRDIHRLLSAAESGLHENLTGLQNRLTKMDNPILQPLDPRRNTIDSRDLFLGHVHKILEPLASNVPRDGQLFQMYSQVLEWSGNLIESLQRLESAVGVTEQTQTSVLRKLEQILQQYQRVLHSKSNTTGGTTTLGLQSLDSLVQFEDLLSSLEKSIKDIIKDVEAKKKVLRSDNLKAMERNLFLCFFNDTTRLKRTVAELAARVAARV